MRLLLLATAMLALPPAAGAQGLFEAPWIAYNTDEPATGQHMAMADVTGDGVPDALVARGSSGFTLLPGDGEGGFGPPASFSSPTPYSFDIVAGDFTGDGQPDVVVSNTNQGISGSTVTLFRNTGGGTFAAPVSFQVGTSPMYLAAADFNGDGRLDLVVGLGNVYATEVAVLRNTGGAFAAPTLHTVGGRPGAIAAGDLTGDGRPDLAVAHYVYGQSTKLSVLRNNGSGGFPIIGTYTEPWMNWEAIALGDVDRDGDLDVVSENYDPGPSTSDFLLYPNAGSGTLGAPRHVEKILYTFTSDALAVADLNGDDWPDLIGHYTSGRSGDGPQVALSDGSGGFLPVDRYPGGQWAHAVDVADVDTDGDLDLLSLDGESDAVAVHENPGDGRFPQTPTWDVGAWNIYLDLGDVDGDGDLDALTSVGASTDGNGRVSINDGSGAFSTVRPVERPGGIAHGKLRDMDGDGDLDVLANSPDTNPPYDFFTALNNGAGQFGPLTRHFTNSCAWGHVDAFDFDNDGDLDVVNLEEQGCIGGGGGAVYLSRNNGNATFAPPILLDLLVGIFSMAGGDFDGDGNMDLAIANSYGNQVHVLLGNGDLTFEAADYAVDYRPYDIEAADLDGDGDLDLATANNGHDAGESVSVILNDGTGAFGPPAILRAPNSSDLGGTTGLAIGDVDGDGDADLLWSGVSNAAAVYLNDGDGAFTYARHRYGLWYGPWDVQYADVTGDGIGDLVAIVGKPVPYPETHLGVVAGLAGATAPVAVAAQPVGGTVVIGPGGGSFQFTVTLTNLTNHPQPFQAWSTVAGPVNREPVVGPQAVTLPAGATITRTLTQQVPANAPAGQYTYTVNIGNFPGAVLASDSFPFVKQAARVAGASASVTSTTDWTASGWDEAVTAAATLPGGFALSEVYPNPFRGHAHLTLEVVEGQTVTVAAYDALGRHVATLHDGEVEAGTHAFALDGTALPAGLYVVRVTGETFVATRRAALVR